MRLIDSEGTQVGIVPIEEAMKKAEEAGLDLVEVAPEARPPVCRIFDYRKIMYEQKRRQKESRKKTHHVELKEIKARVTIDPHDLEVKTKRARKFLEQGHKVKLTIQYRGREITKQHLGSKLVQQVLITLGDIAEVEQGLTRQGRQQHLILTRSKDYGKKPPEEPDQAKEKEEAHADTSSAGSVQGS